MTPKTPILDAPPIDLLRQYVPEVVESLTEVTEVVAAAHRARVRWTETLDGNGTTPSGSAAREARAVDVRAVAEGRPPHALAELIRSRPDRESEYWACAGYAEQRVGEWQRTARELVEVKTIERLQAHLAEAEASAQAAAEAAVASAGGRRDEPRLDDAWPHLADMDRAVAQWRELASLLTWCVGAPDEGWGRCHARFRGAWPGTQLGDAGWDRDPIMQARGLRDRKGVGNMLAHHASVAPRAPLREDPRRKIFQPGGGRR